MEEMPLHDVCLEMQGSKLTTRLLIGRLVSYQGENALLASPKKHSQIDL
jgi:hypothetical protein